MFDVTIAIPAKNEVEMIGAALSAISVAASRVGARPCVIVLANDCVDGTVDRVRRCARNGSLAVRVIECALPPDRADAGRARRIAMSAAHMQTSADGFIVTTDADAALRPDALEAFEAHFRAGADLVCGAISTTLPPHLLASPSLQRIDRITQGYAALAREVRHAIDVLYGIRGSGSPPHYMEAGACMAVSARFFERVGGLPDIPTAEDRALVRLVERAGGRVVYCDRAHATVSARLEGRAAGGMAETIRRRLAAPDPIADEALRSCAAIRTDWQEALLALDTGVRPPVRAAVSRLRASDLERDLLPLTAFVNDVVRPDLAAMQNAGALACSA